MILVSKDINMRIKARALGLDAQDYFNDKVLEDSDLLYTGVLPLPDDFWDRHSKDMKSWQKDGRTYYQISRPAVRGIFRQPVRLSGKRRHTLLRDRTGTRTN